MNYESNLPLVGVVETPTIAIKVDVNPASTSSLLKETKELIVRELSTFFNPAVFQVIGEDQDFFHLQCPSVMTTGEAFCLFKRFFEEDDFIVKLVAEYEPEYLTHG